jgi:L-threonylcarbamoyladenylate synthase
VRVPAHEVPRALCRTSALLVTATSANRSGEPATHDPDVVAATLGDVIDVLVDGGLTPGGAPSTIVDVFSSGARLIRAGAIEWDLIEAVMQAPDVASARRSSG